MSKEKTPHKYIGTRGHLYDVIAAIGGNVRMTGEGIEKSAVHFPATIDWVIDDLEHLAEYATRTAATMKQMRDLMNQHNQESGEEVARQDADGDCHHPRRA